MSKGIFHIKLVYAKGGLMRFISHRDLIRVIKQAVIRSDIPVAHSSGFNPRPKISFYNPLPVGVESECEVLSLATTEFRDASDVKNSLNAQFPEGIYCITGKNIRSKKEICVVSSQYRMPVSSEEGNRIEPGIPRIAEPAVTIRRERNNKVVTVADKVGGCTVENGFFSFTLKNTPIGSISPKEFLSFFFNGDESVRKLYALKRCGINGRTGCE